MPKTIKVDDLQNTIIDYLEDYVEDIEDNVVEITDSVTKEAVNELKRNSPRGKGIRKNPYYKGWTRQTGKAALKNHRYTIKIHNRTNYQLTHILEDGHATRNGGRTKAIPHIRPVEEKYNKLYEQKITTVLRRR